MIFELTYGKHKGCRVTIVKRNGTACQVCTVDDEREVFWCKTDALRLMDHGPSRYAFDRGAVHST